MEKIIGGEKERSLGGRICQKNPLKIATTFITTYGLLTIFAYHFHIDYFPAFDIKSLTSLIFAVAYVGITMSVLFSMTLFVPCYFVWMLNQSRNQMELPQIALSFVVAWMGFMVMGIATVIFSIFDWSGYWILLVLVCIALICYGYQMRGASAGSEKETKEDSNLPERRKQARYYSGCMTLICALQVLPLLMWFLVLEHAPSLQSADNQKDLVSLTPKWFSILSEWFSILSPIFLCGIFLQVFGFYIVVSWSRKDMHVKHRLASTMLAFMFPLFSTIVLHFGSFFPSATAFTTKIGNFGAIEMTISDTGCKILAQQSAPICHTLNKATNKVCGAYVMSRIGSETYLKVSYPLSIVKPPADEKSKREKDAPDAKGEVKDIYIPSKEILGIKPDQKKRFFDKESVKAELSANPSVCDQPKAEARQETMSFDSSTLFSYDSYDISTDGQVMLQALADRYSKAAYAKLSLSVVGYADQIGSPHHNVTLSELRALAVANFLQKRLGIPVDGYPAVAFKGVGATQPKKSDTDCPPDMSQKKRVDCLADNRRVEVKISYEKSAVNS